ncbi:MAG: hypothetical protein ACOX52_13870 [Verrucomicrobiota bacterium]
MVPGFSCPNPIPPPFDTETDSDPDPDLPSPSTFSDSPSLSPPLRHRALCGRLSGSEWGGSRGDRRGRRGLLERGNAASLERFSATALVCRKRISPKSPPPKSMDQGLDTTHHHGQVENATAPSAGGSPDGKA